MTSRPGPFRDAAGSDVGRTFAQNAYTAASGGWTMRRTVFFVCCGFLLTSHLTLTRARQAPVYESTPVTVTATIEAVDKENRTVTLKGPKRGSVQVKAPEQMEGFNSLRVGDAVTATYFEAIALSVRKPGTPTPAAGPTTSTQRKDCTPGSETRREQTFTVTVEAVDPKAPSVTVKGPQGRVVQFMVRDATQLSNIEVGDTVDVTYYESLLIKVSRPSR